MATTLEISDLHVSLAGRPVLDQLSLRVEPGEFLGLIGPNGAGKTTLFRSILGLIRPVAGQITVAGTRVDKARGALGYVPQRHDFAWDFPISVHDTVLTGRTRSIGWLRRPKLADFEAVATALDLVRLTELADRPIGELSGGQRQRVLVARALTTDPSLLLLDEPFTGLDIPSTELLLDLFAQLAAQGVSIIMSTHNLAEAMEVCNRVVLLNGRIVADGPPEQLRDPALWQKVFGVSATSPLLKVVGAA
ncbi:anchored repeat-type ABC transporter ATP-binding subunit [Corynebacterium epidermidicanis]|uniref:anchored repeat-type ABC transporter ATP-binding subunit n=1 Tax=Corynebacterium epidermidicanis TaxID=1050174 RepID=UPI00191C37BD|nr:anchored repeat-type ABC transporter ATP-binding subunit [Corynebacterium epidermidicanis]